MHVDIHRPGTVDRVEVLLRIRVRAPKESI